MIFAGAAQIASGSKHTLAMRADGQLFGCGGADGETPRPLMSGVTATAAGFDGSAAIDIAGTVWRSRVGSPPQPLPRRARAAAAAQNIVGANGGAGGHPPVRCWSIMRRSVCFSASACCRPKGSSTRCSCARACSIRRATSRVPAAVMRIGV